MQKFPYYLDHFLIYYEFLKMQMKYEIKIEIENELFEINLNIEVGASLYAAFHLTQSLANQNSSWKRACSQ